MSGQGPREWGSGLPADSDDTVYEVSVVENRRGKPVLKQTTAGGSKTTGAWLRALADEIDPPQRIMRTGRPTVIPCGGK